MLLLNLPEVLVGLPVLVLAGFLVDGETLRPRRVEHEPHVRDIVRFACQLNQHINLHTTLTLPYRMFSVAE